MSGVGIGKEKRGLYIVLGLLSVMVVGLAIANIVIFVQVGQVDNTITGQTESQGDNYIINADGSTTPLRKDQIGEPVPKRKVETKGKSFDEVVAEYQVLIDNAKSNEEKVELYNERIMFAFDYGNWKEHGDLIIADAIAVDNIVGSVDSAVQVVNVANSVGNEEVRQIYDARVAERVGPVENEIDEYHTIDVGKDGMSNAI